MSVEFLWALQGEGPTRSPWRVGAGVGPARGARRVPVDPVGRFPGGVLPEAPDSGQMLLGALEITGFLAQRDSPEPQDLLGPCL